AYQDVRLSPALIGNGAAGRVLLLANGLISMPANVGLQLPAAGSFGAFGGQIDVAGRIDGAGASIQLQTRPTPSTLQGNTALRLEGTAQLTVAGAWVNDSPAQNSLSRPLPLTTNGGSVSLGALDGDLLTAAGSVVDVSGGAYLSPNASLTAGK